MMVTTSRTSDPILRTRPRNFQPTKSKAAAKFQGGFTILEVAIATFVMAFGIATSIVALQTGFKTVDVARGSTLASQILQSEIERIRLMNWGDVTAMIGTAPVPLGSMYSSESGVASKFAVSRTVALESGARSSDVALITLTVDWKSHDGRDHRRRFETKYVKNGLYDYYYTLARP